MVENKSSLFSIIAIIIGAAGLGVGAYSMVSFQVVEGPQGLPGDDGEDGLPGQDGFDGTNGINGTDGIDGINGTLDNLVGVWESLYCNLQYDGEEYSDEISVDDMRVNKSEYFYLSYSPNTTFHLTKKGWYRFTIRFIWAELTVNTYYMLKMYHSYAGEIILVYFWHKTDAPDYLVNTVAYTHCDVGDYIWFECRGYISEIYHVQRHNQLVLEYLGE